MRSTLLTFTRLAAFLLIATALAGLLAGCSYPPRGDPGGQRDPYERGMYNGPARNHDNAIFTQIWFSSGSRYSDCRPSRGHGHSWWHGGGGHHHGGGGAWVGSGGRWNCR